MLENQNYQKKETSNKENETTTENQKICQKFPTKEKPTINFKPIILNEKEEKIEKMKKENFENEITLQKLKKSIQAISNIELLNKGKKSYNYHNNKFKQINSTNNKKITDIKFLEIYNEETKSIITL